MKRVQRSPHVDIHKDTANRSRASTRLVVAANRARDAGDDSGALNLYQQFLTTNPDDACVVLAMGEIYARARMTEDAKTLFRRAIELNPKLAMPHINLGGVLSNDDRDFKGAIECFMTALECPDVSEQAAALAHGNMGFTFNLWSGTNECGGAAFSYDVERLDKAIDHLKKSNKIYKKSGGALKQSTHAQTVRMRLAQCKGRKADLAKEQTAAATSPLESAMAKLFGEDFSSWADYTSCGFGEIFHMQTACATCGGATTKKCAGCCVAYFCSKECQLAGWPTHKVVCKSKALDLPTYRTVKSSAPMPLVAIMNSPHANHADVADVCLSEMLNCLKDPYPEDNVDIAAVQAAMARVEGVHPSNVIIKQRLADLADYMRATDAEESVENAPPINL